MARERVPATSDEPLEPVLPSKGLKWALIGMAVATLGSVAYLVHNQPISDISRTVRGLITVVFTVGTLSVALILVIGVLLQRKLDEASKRFVRGKEILTMLVGILGTIIGFYFGTEDSIDPGPLLVGEVIVSETSPQIGSSFTLTALIEGGRPPFDYTFRFVDMDGKEVVGLSPIQGHILRGQWIQRVVSLSEIDEPQKIKVEVKVNDITNATSTYNEERSPIIDIVKANGSSADSGGETNKQTKPPNNGS